MTKFIVVLLFILWCYLALGIASGGDVALLVGVTIMIVLVEITEK